ncbi:MAG: hypothetical protein HFI60_18115 [Lachnospiraceae bacterium]|jgi:hypothetical protein|nr:hypothetical protein [Lachnospiraceae bacterium]
MEVQKTEMIEYLKLSEKVQSEFNGIEEDDDNENIEADEPYEVQNIRNVKPVNVMFAGFIAVLNTA